MKAQVGNLRHSEQVYGAIAFYLGHEAEFDANLGARLIALPQ
jgi:hypothetical protein